MTVLSLLAVAGACAVAARWWTRRQDALGRRRPFPYLSVAVLVVSSLLLAVPGFLRHREEDRLSWVASQLVGAPVTVHCQSLGGEMVDIGSELGYVKWRADGVPERQTLIKHGPCRQLNAYLESSKQHPTDDEVIAVHVLTHESMHMRGLTSESEAECAAVQRDAETARLLGAGAADAAALARRYWSVMYPRMPDDYRTSSCSPGGRLDQHLPDAPWTAAGGAGWRP
ncbi:MAG TPA: hypothetical protein VFJ98_01020 [Mycobacteriales bacterium]|nr:hypothetical protein [Mycobacteriales bacterium]